MTETSKETGKKKIHLLLSDRNADRLREMSERYGMSLNSLVAYILGQWLDTNYDLKDRILDKMIREQEIQQESEESDVKAFEPGQYNLAKYPFVKG